MFDVRCLSFLMFALLCESVVVRCLLIIACFSLVVVGWLLLVGCCFSVVVC